MTTTSRVDGRFSDPGATGDTWVEVTERLAAAQIAWIGTVRTDGRPHLTPLVTVWFDGALHFCTGADEQKRRNLAHDARMLVLVGTGSASWDDGADVVVEGRAERVTDPATLDRLAEAWRGRWDGRWRFEVEDGAFTDGHGPALVHRVAPDKVLSFGRGETFHQTRHEPPAPEGGTR
ncbi:pyridoxamine 5'-phosphate oxidase family protein [Phycicoccus sp. BSK3Z-2]|uniref:Pyridoxamine 5'-phosphate oxidase family protein n=1 Tax=Phycicoccus avicenniae TaxID=2828860 RepID=A0A941DAB3_9MICO|nr:pyridoxamine 5'-phosphate oxidase family protein [Phycicoccus avicenniae]MBR7742752.1 pyridoxamine 5'-phosphate oxidase family protein [Phycicoccus avicenniae]